MNDVATANALTGICAERCASSPAAHRAAGYTLGWHEKAAEQTWDGVTAMWERLARRDRFWEDRK
jgi:hypothetical protein